MTQVRSPSNIHIYHTQHPKEIVHSLYLVLLSDFGNHMQTSFFLGLPRIQFVIQSMLIGRERAFQAWSPLAPPKKKKPKLQTGSMLSVDHSGHRTNSAAFFSILKFILYYSKLQSTVSFVTRQVSIHSVFNKITLWHTHRLLYF